MKPTSTQLQTMVPPAHQAISPRVTLISRTASTREAFLIPHLSSSGLPPPYHRAGCTSQRESRTSDSEPTHLMFTVSQIEFLAHYSALVILCHVTNHPNVVASLLLLTGLSWAAPPLFFLGMSSKQVGLRSFGGSSRCSALGIAGTCSFPIMLVSGPLLK